MGEILGLGLTHSPPLLAAAGDTASPVTHDAALCRSASRIRRPRRNRAPSSKGATTRAKTHAQQHRAELVECMAVARSSSTTFNPDLVIYLSATTKYENFGRSVPAFQIQLLGLHSRPGPGSTTGPAQRLERSGRTRCSATRPTAESPTPRHSAHRGGFRVAYAYEPPRGDADAILTRCLPGLGRRASTTRSSVLDNCYGRQLSPLRGAVSQLADVPRRTTRPPGPTPWRCFDLGRALART